MSTPVLDRLSVRRRVPLGDRVVHRMRRRVGPSPAALRDAPCLEPQGTEPSRQADARKDEGRAGFPNAVSLRVQPQLVLALRAALAHVRGIKAAFVYGSAARSAPSPPLPRKRGREAHAAPASDIDLMVIAEDASYAVCVGSLLHAEKLLERRIRTHFVSTQEWRRRCKRKSGFVTQINAQSRIFIFASADDLG